MSLEKITAKQVLKKAMDKLNYNLQDIINVAARYLNENLKRRNNEKGYNNKSIDLSKYPSKNFNEDKWNDYLTSMISLGLEKKLECQTIISAINSEELLREYFSNRYASQGDDEFAADMLDKKQTSHAYLAVKFANEFVGGIRTPTSIFALKNVKLGEYIGILRQQAEKGVKADKIIKDLLENFPDYLEL
ncbi:MAG: hypothetical protein PHS81_04135 [Candidatus Nanoarchaeia archaeon]|nr:hypothetical protein [Candidatus Nanoarchaeia archaeon]